MKVHLISVGSKMPTWVQEGYREYARRLPPELTLVLYEVPLAGRGKGRSLERTLAEESARMLATVPKRCRVVALDVMGKPKTTESLAEDLREWLASGQEVALLVGGPDGLHPDCLAVAQERWSLSRLTFPHPLVRVVLAEQLYRAWTVLRGHPYHRA